MFCGLCCPWRQKPWAKWRDETWGTKETKQMWKWANESESKKSMAQETEKKRNQKEMNQKEMEKEKEVKRCLL